MVNKIFEQQSSNKIALLCRVRFAE